MKASFLITALWLTTLTASGLAAEPAAQQQAIEADWLQQKEGQCALAAITPEAATATWADATWADAAGGVDGVKNGRFGFATRGETNPWWRVDLGRTTEIARIVVFNRLDYPSNLRNTDTLRILVSDNDKDWRQIYDNAGKSFGGISGAPPLEVRFPPGQLKARFVRLQILSDKRIVLHLDEVEVYGVTDPKVNLALKRPADQSSAATSFPKPGAMPPGAQVVGKEELVGDDPVDASYPTARFIARGRLLAADLRAAGVDPAVPEKELDACEAVLKAGRGSRSLYLRVRRAVRQLVFANPLLKMDKLLFVKRFGQETYTDVCLSHMPWVSRPGGDICVLTSPFEADGKGQQVLTLLSGQLGAGRVHGVDLSWDGTRVVFGYAKSKTGKPPAGFPGRMGHDVRLAEEPTHIFEIGVDGKGLRQLTDSKDWSDLDPTYLPNGDICFVSERCGFSLQCNNASQDETSCNLYVMKSDGSGIKRLSVTKDGDYLPHTLSDGTIGYTRWEYHERGWAKIQSLWTVRPDGTYADAVFKQHFNDPWAIEEARSIPGSTKLLAVATGHHTLPAGPVVVVDPSVGINNARGIAIVTPGVRPPEGGMSGLPVSGGGVDDRGGFYMQPWPLSEKHFLVSYAYCSGRSIGMMSEVDPTGYALYYIDVYGNKELIYRDAAISCYHPIPLRPRPRPPILHDSTDPSKPYAVCLISDVTQGVPGVKPGQAKYLRIAEPVGWPYDRASGGQRFEADAKSQGINWTPIRVLGTVPIDPDGSAHFRVPHDVAVYFQLLDENFMELRRMRSFISFQPGENRSCVGCHETQAASLSAGGVGTAHRRPARDPQPPPWGDRAISFLRDVQPVLDRNCVKCHTGLKPAGGYDFSGGLTANHNRAYDTIIGKRLIAFSDKNDDSKITMPMAFGSHKSRLIAAVRGEAHKPRLNLSSNDWLTLVTWVDVNGPYHGDFINKRLPVPPYELALDTALQNTIQAVHTRRCAACHKPDEVTRLDWIDLQAPNQSRFLAAPLAASAGGLGKCKGGNAPAVYVNAADPDYAAVLNVVTAAVKKAWDAPRRDLRSFNDPVPAPRLAPLANPDKKVRNESPGH